MPNQCYMLTAWIPLFLRIRNHALLHKGLWSAEQHCRWEWRPIPGAPGQVDDGQSAIGQRKKDIVVVLPTSDRRYSEPRQRVRRVQLALVFGEQTAPFVFIADRIPGRQPLSDHGQSG